MRYERTRHAAVRTEDYVFAQLIPYLGNKRKLLGLIGRAIDSTGVSEGTFVDLFAGSGVVSRYAKSRGFSVTANDWEPYAAAINGCWIACDRAPAFASLGGYAMAVETLNALPPQIDWVTAHLCPDDDDVIDIARDRMFYTRENGMRIDAIRTQIESWMRDGTINRAEADCLIAPLLYCACYTANTSGVFKGFHNGWGGRTATAIYRIRSRLQLRTAGFQDSPRRSRVASWDAAQLARQMRSDRESIDIAYLDPPYNQHPYSSNYHVLNSIAAWDKPATTSKIESRGTKSAIRDDWRATRRSAYNHRGEAERAFRELVVAIDARFILTSYSTDGMIELESMLDACVARGQTCVIAKPYKRYRVSSQRFSAKPMNVEFVVVTDCARPHAGPSIASLAQQIRDVEAECGPVSR